jgi:hypothetical protein
MKQRDFALRAAGASHARLARRAARPFLLLLTLGLAAGVSGCSSISEKLAGDMSEMPAIGLPANAPARPDAPPTFPAVHDMPPPRAAAVLNDVEQQKLEDDLVAAREQQQAIVAPKAKSRQAHKKKEKPAPVAAPRPLPTASARSIY